MGQLEDITKRATTGFKAKYRDRAHVRDARAPFEEELRTTARSINHDLLKLLAQSQEPA